MLDFEKRYERLELITGHPCPFCPGKLRFTIAVHCDSCDRYFLFSFSSRDRYTFSRIYNGVNYMGVVAYIRYDCVREGSGIYYDDILLSSGSILPPELVEVIEKLSLLL